MPRSGRPLYWPKRRLSSETAPAPMLAQLEGFVSACSSASCAATPPATSSPAPSPVAANAFVRASMSPPERALVRAVERIVRAVDVGVAVEAAARQEVGRGAAACGVLRADQARDVAAVAGRLVALLAQVRRPLPQQVVVRRAVRVVAQRAVLLHRLVGAHERAALLHVAAVAGVVDVAA